MYWALIVLVLGNLAFFALHLKDLQSFPPPLDKEQEQQLFVLCKQGDKHARDELITHNLRLVAHVCKKYHTDDRLDPEDLISIGTIGLLKAVDSFEPNKGVAFSTYGARCIENEVLMQFRWMKKSEGTLFLGDSLDSGEGSSLTYLDIAGDEEDLQVLTELRQSATQLIVVVNQVLNSRERIIIKLRYGLDGSAFHTQKQVAALLGISRSYVSRIEKGALGKLRQKLESANS